MYYLSFWIWSFLNWRFCVVWFVVGKLVSLLNCPPWFVFCVVWFAVVKIGFLTELPIASCPTCILPIKDKQFSSGLSCHMKSPPKQTQILILRNSLLMLANIYKSKSQLKIQHQHRSWISFRCDDFYKIGILNETTF